MRHQFEGYVHFSTVRAILFEGHYWHTPRWLPRSQIELKTSLDTDEVIVNASGWICEKNEIREFTEHE